MKRIFEFELFKNLSAGEKFIISETLELKEFKAGESIFSKGEWSSFTAILASGQIDLFNEDHLIRCIGEGSVFGQEGMLLKQNRSLSAIAREDSSCYLIDDALLKQCFERSAGLEAKILRNLSFCILDNLLQSDENLVELISQLNRQNRLIEDEFQNLSNFDTVDQTILTELYKKFVSNKASAEKKPSTSFETKSYVMIDSLSSIFEVEIQKNSRIEISLKELGFFETGSKLKGKLIRQGHRPLMAIFEVLSCNGLKLTLSAANIFAARNNNEKQASGWR